MTLRALKWSVPVDDRPHEIGGGKVLHVACQNGPDAVEVWTLELNDSKRWVQVFGTGQPLPGSVTAFVGTALASPLVWHVFEVRE